MKRLLQLLLVLIPAIVGITGALSLMAILGDARLDIARVKFFNENTTFAFFRADVLIVLILVLGLFTSLIELGIITAKIRLEQLQDRSLRQEKLQAQTQAIRDRHRFLQRLDHELKNPLTAIRVGLANLDNGNEASGQHETLNSVNAQVHRISRLTADLRKLAELDTRPIERSPVNMTGLLQQVFELAHERVEAESRRLSLILPQAPWPLPIISGDRDLLLLVIHNLIDNAIKFTRPGDTIEVRAFEDSAAIVVEVADTGPGIAEEDLAHVWEELYRGQGARGVPGSGLGLALSTAIIQRHEGQIMLRSRIGQGTVFTVRLPNKS